MQMDTHGSFFFCECDTKRISLFVIFRVTFSSIAMENDDSNSISFLEKIYIEESFWLFLMFIRSIIWAKIKHICMKFFRSCSAHLESLRLALDKTRRFLDLYNSTLGYIFGIFRLSKNFYNSTKSRIFGGSIIATMTDYASTFYSRTGGAARKVYGWLSGLKSTGKRAFSWVFKKKKPSEAKGPSISSAIITVSKAVKRTTNSFLSMLSDVSMCGWLLVLTMLMVGIVLVIQILEFSFGMDSKPMYQFSLSC